MGAKAPGGTHTFAPTSPSGPSRLVTVSADGNTLTDQGIDYSWDEQQGLYRARVPPPLGLWRFIELTPGEGFTSYEMVEEGHSLPVEVGKDFWSG